MKLNIYNKYLNVSCNYLNHIQKTVRTFTGRNKEWFESPLLFMFLNFSLEFQNDMSCNSTRIWRCCIYMCKNKFLRLKELFQLQCFLKESMSFITCIFFLKPFAEKNRQVALFYWGWVWGGGWQQIKDIHLPLFCIHFYTPLKYVTIIFIMYCR